MRSLRRQTRPRRNTPVVTMRSCAITICCWFAWMPAVCCGLASSCPPPALFQLIAPPPCVQVQVYNPVECELRAQVVCANETWPDQVLVDPSAVPYTVVEQCWPPTQLEHCSVRLGCPGQTSRFEFFDSVSAPPACPVSGLSYKLRQLSCTQAHLSVRIPLEMDIWVMPPLLSPFIAAKGTMLTQEIDRVYIGNTTLRWWFLPISRHDTTAPCLRICCASGPSF